jgi:ribosomal protein S9
MTNYIESEYVSPYEPPKEKQSNIKKKDWSNIDRVMGTGKRKSCRAICIIKPGKGVVTVNKEAFIRYFPCPLERRKCLKAMDIAGVACDFDVVFHLHGGGVSA